MECTNVRDSGFNRWHAIYQTAGLDYCREDAPERVDLVEDAKRWAVDFFAATADRAARRAVDSFRLERW